VRSSPAAAGARPVAAERVAPAGRRPAQNPTAGSSQRPSSRRPGGFADAPGVSGVLDEVSSTGVHSPLPSDGPGPSSTGGRTGRRPAAGNPDVPGGQPANGLGMTPLGWLDANGERDARASATDRRDVNRPSANSRDVVGREIDRYDVERHDIDRYEIDRYDVDRYDVDRGGVGARDVARGNADHRDAIGRAARGGGSEGDGGRDDEVGGVRNGRGRPRSRPLTLVQVLIVIAVLVVGTSLGRTLVLPGDAGVLTRVAAWGRANHLSFLVDGAERLR
ncbi:hypothetical protein MXD58_023835, partial [Frankia sp. AgKG'84/4]|nr:hypothetical protein [Frankia sp. AgKG'84/4]